MTDPNGNQVSTDGAGNFTDTTGKVVLQVAGNAPNAQTYTYTDTMGTSRAVSVSYKTYTVQTNFGCSGIGEYGPISTSLVDAISLPDGQSVYHFAYEATPGVSGAVTGRPASVTLPGGGVIGYTYTGGNNGIVCGDGSAAGLTRTMLSDSPNTSWTYTRSAGTSTSHSNVVDGLGNNFDYDFVAATVPSGALQLGAFFYEVNRNAWNGAASGPHAYSQQTCYNHAGSICIGTAITLPVAQVDTYQIANDQQEHGTTTLFNQYGGPTEIDTKDYGQFTNNQTDSRGALLSKEVLGYGACGPANLVSSDTITDGAGNTVSKKTFCYDETTVTSTSNVPSHVAATGSRGNLTTTTTYTGGINLVTTATYADTGSLLSSTDSINGTTSYSYDGTYTYATGSTLPTPSSGVTMTAGAGYDTANTGLPTSATDVNNAQTNYSGYDALLHLTEIDYPASPGQSFGGKVTFTYAPTYIRTQTFQTNSTQNPGDTERQLDGYGRTSRVAVTNGTLWYQQDTCYDGNHTVAFASNVYAGSGFIMGKVCSGAGDTFTYDSLGRTVTVSHQDGSSISYAYIGRATQTTDENGVKKITQSDGLGRPTMVCEISSNPLAGVSPVACGTDIAGTGFVTAYAYGYASGNPQTTVTQGAQTRVFQTDWVGRPALTTEPERGTTTYSYSSDSTGAVVTRKRPRANQSNVSVVTTTTTQYDKLSRVVGITYDDNLTPARTYLYDQSNAWGDSGNVGLGSSKGRLTRHIVNAGNGMGATYGYDAMGHVVFMETCRASTCGHGAERFDYTYDGMGNRTSDTYYPSGTGNASVQTTYGYNVANQLISISGGQNNATGAPTIVSVSQAGPAGPLAWTYGNGLTAGETYDSAGRASGLSVCNNGSFQQHCGGSSLYSFSLTTQGSRVKQACDQASGQCFNYGYDEFNRLTSSMGVNPQTFSYTYDRYGNRLTQNAPQGGPAPSFAFNPVNNQIVSAQYDVAGNLLADGVHTYQYDAEGNQVSVDNGQTAQYVYDALNQRVWMSSGGGTPSDEPVYQETDYDPNGRRVQIWDGAAGTLVQTQTYWGALPVAYTKQGTISFQHQNWLGSAGITSDARGNLTGSYNNAFGDGFQTNNTVSDRFHFAQLDHDWESGNEHARFREYSPMQGRWVSPDPYDGSYDEGNPQSLNRYAYVLNNPMAFTDPLGLCTTTNVLDGDGNIIQTVTVGVCDDWGYSPGATAVPWYISDYGGQYGQPGGQCMLSNGGVIPCPQQGATKTTATQTTAPNNAPQPINWKKVGSCLVDSTLKHYGLDALTAGSGALAIPISKSLVPPFRMIGEPTTNLLSVLGHYVEINVPRITIDGLASTNLLRIAGRANPYVAGALLAIDVGMISYDTYQCYQKQ